jgi:hypothetical protein
VTFTGAKADNIDEPQSKCNLQVMPCKIDSINDIIMYGTDCAETSHIKRHKAIKDVHNTSIMYIVIMFIHNFIFDY